MATRLRWWILFVYSWIGTQFMLNWFIFGSITKQAQEYYHLSTPASGSVNHQIATILSLGPFVFLCVAPFAIYMLRYPVIGLQLSMRVAAVSTFVGMLFICIPSILSLSALQSVFKYEYTINGTSFNTLIWLYIGATINCIASPLFLSSPSKLSVIWFSKSERNTITGFGATVGNLGQSLAYFIPPLVVTHYEHVSHLLFVALACSFSITCIVFAYFPAHPKRFPTLASKISVMSSSHLLPEVIDSQQQHSVRSTRFTINSGFTFPLNEEDEVSVYSDVESNHNNTDNNNTSDTHDGQTENERQTHVQTAGCPENMKTDEQLQQEQKQEEEEEIFEDAEIIQNNVEADDEATKSEYESLPFGHFGYSTTNALLSTNASATTSNGTSNHSNANQSHKSSYTPLPFAHSATNLFASDLELNKTDFREYLSFLMSDLHRLFSLRQKDKSCILLLVAGGFTVGTTSGWSSVLQDMMAPIGISQTVIGYIGACLVSAQIVGALVGGPIVDRYFHGQLKKCIIVFQCMDITWYLMAFLLVPNALIDNKSLLVIDDYNTRCSVLFVVCSLIGFNFGLLIPLYFELLAEISFPVAETTATNAVMVICVPVMMGIIQLASINTSYDTLLALILLCVALILDLFVVEQYRRPKCDFEI